MLSDCRRTLNNTFLFVLREPIIRLFISDADVVHYGVLMLVAYMLSGPVIGLLFVNMNCMQSTGNALPCDYTFHPSSGIAFDSAIVSAQCIIRTEWCYLRTGTDRLYCSYFFDCDLGGGEKEVCYLVH